MKSKKTLVLKALLCTSFALGCTFITLLSNYHGWALLQHIL